MDLGSALDGNAEEPDTLLHALRHCFMGASGGGTTDLYDSWGHREYV